MRHVILAAALMPLAFAAFAQTNTGNMGARPAPAPSSGGPTTSGGMVSNWTVQPPDPNNCGTPDAPAKCPPMPRTPLKYFPPNRHKVTG
jgi:hypothetical protein